MDYSSLAKQLLNGYEDMSIYYLEEAYNSHPSGWYFCNEVNELMGPFEDKAEAIKHLFDYLEMMKQNGRIR